MVTFLEYSDLYDAIMLEFLSEELTPEMSTKLRRMMKNAVVRFSYKKKNGSTREASGTLQKKYLPKYKTNKRPKPNPGRFVYWDVDKEMFRSFLRKNFVKILKQAESGKHDKEDAAGA